MLLEQFYSNDKAKKTLVNFLTDGRFPHTILLEGEDGCGKTDLCTHDRRCFAVLNSRLRRSARAVGMQKL